jgi:hypothetical protein
MRTDNPAKDHGRKREAAYLLVENLKTVLWR